MALLRNSGCVAGPRAIFFARKAEPFFMESSNQFLGTQPVGKLMGRYAVPCIISLLVGALYNIVDQIFIANASYLGSYGNAANTVVFPPHGGGAGHRGHGGGWLLCLCQPLPGPGPTGHRQTQRGQRH